MHKRSLFHLDRVSSSLRRDLPIQLPKTRPQYLAERALRLLVHDVPSEPAEASLPFDGFASLADKLKHIFGTEALKAKCGLLSPMPAMWKFVLVSLLREQRKPDSLDLLAAVNDTDEPRVAALIAKGADADYYATKQRSAHSDKEEVTSPLCEVAKQLLETDGLTPSRVSILRRLLEEGADANRTINAPGKEVLADGDHVQLLRCAGIGMLAPLAALTRVAVAHGESAARLDSLSLAIEHGADINYLGNHRGYSWAAIHIAVAALDQPATELLIRAGADLTVTNVAPGGAHNGKRGNGICYAPIHLVCRAWTDGIGGPAKSALGQFLAFLVEQGANVNLQDKNLERARGGDRLSPMQLATVDGNEELASVLARLAAADMKPVQQVESRSVIV